MSYKVSQRLNCNNRKQHKVLVISFLKILGIASGIGNNDGMIFHTALPLFVTGLVRWKVLLS